MNAPLTQAEQIEALTAKCALLAASLKQAETQSTHRARLDAVDCASLYREHSCWHLALFEAIGKFADDQHRQGLALDVGDRETVFQLAKIGVYLADAAVDVADTYKTDAESELSQTA